MYAAWAKGPEKPDKSAKYSLAVKKAHPEDTGLNDLHNLSERQLMERMRELFMQVDDDNSGTLEFDEFVNFYSEIQKLQSGAGSMSQTFEVAKIFDAIDVDGSGSIDFKEFMEWQLQEIKRQKRRPSRPVVGNGSNGILSARRNLKSPEIGGFTPISTPQRMQSPMPPLLRGPSPAAELPAISPAGSRRGSKETRFAAPSPVPLDELEYPVIRAARSPVPPFSPAPPLSPVPPEDDEPKFGKRMSAPAAVQPKGTFGRRKSAPVAVDGRFAEEQEKAKTEKHSLYERLVSPRSGSKPTNREPIPPPEAPKEMKWERGQWRKKTGHQAMLDLGDFETKLKVHKNNAKKEDEGFGFQKKKNAAEFKTLGSEWSSDGEGR
jgi:hypothetical protein